MSVQRRPRRVRGRGHDEFWAFCEAGELRMQRCKDCGHVQWPPVPDACERCELAVLEWERLSGTGQIVSWCTFERSYYPDLPVPWDTILVELEEGPLFISNPDGFTNEEVRINMPVRVTFVDCEDETGRFRLPAFEPVGPAGPKNQKGPQDETASTA